MNINAKIINKIMANQTHNISEISFTLTKLASSQGYRSGLTYTNL
jgi:hypothetical protein